MLTIIISQKNITLIQLIPYIIAHVFVPDFNLNGVFSHYQRLGLWAKTDLVVSQLETSLQIPQEGDQRIRMPVWFNNRQASQVTAPTSAN